MFKLPSFYLLCIVKAPDLKHRIIVPIPLFLIDDLLSVVPLAIRIAKLTPASRVLKKVDVERIWHVIESSWKSLRHAGSFTMVDFSAKDGTRIYVRMV